MPGHHSRDVPGGVGVREPTLRTWEKEKPPPPAHYCKEWTIQSNEESSPCWGGQESWQVDQLPAATQTQNQDYKLTHPSIHSVCDLLQHWEERGLQGSCGPRAADSLQHRGATGCPGRLPVRAQHWWRSRDQGFKPMILWDKCLQVKNAWTK